MNRRRQAERRKEVSSPKQKQNAELNSSDASKSLMENYFESQKAISNYDCPATETKITKSFKIPKKQPAPIEPVRNESNNVRNNPVKDDSYNRANDDRRSRPRDVRRSPRRDFDRKRIEDNHGTRGNIQSSRNSFDRQTEANGNDKRSPIRINIERDREPRKLEDRRREEGNSNRPRSSENRISPNRHNSREIKRRDEKPRTPSPNVAKRPRLDSSPRRRSPLPGRNNTDKRKNWRKPIELIITDLSTSDGTISPENAEIFLNEIQKSVAERILTDPIHQTKFIGHRHEDGFIFLTCADDFTVSFTQQKLKEEPTLWPGAQLKCNESTHKTTPVYVRLPNSLGFRHFSEFFDACKKSDSRMCTPRWWCIECWDSDDESGRWFKLGIDSESFDLIKRQGRKLICGNTDIPVETVVRRKRQKRIES